MFVSRVCCIVRGLCDDLIIRSEELYLVCVSHCVWDRETSKRGGTGPSWADAPQKTKPAPLTEMCTGLTQFDAKARTAEFVKLGHDRFLPHPFHFIIHHTAMKLYNRSYWECHNLLIYLLTPLCRVLLEQLTGLQLVRNSPHFTEPKGSLPHSQASVTCLYPGPTQSSPYTQIPPPGDPFCYYPPIWDCHYIHKYKRVGQ